jgi:hypothetical protein
VACLAERQILLEEQAWDIEKFSDIPSRKSTKSFRSRKAEFGAEVNLNEEQCMRITVMDLKKETIKMEACKLLLGAFQYVGMSKRKRMPHNIGAFKHRSN